MPCLLSAESQQGGADSMPRSSATRDGSQIRRTAGAIIGERLIHQPTQPAVLGIVFYLAVPDLGIITFEPCAKFSQLGRVQFGDLLFKLLHAAHGDLSFTIPPHEDAVRTHRATPGSRARSQSTFFESLSLGVRLWKG